MTLKMWRRSRPHSFNIKLPTLLINVAMLQYMTRCFPKHSDATKMLNINLDASYTFEISFHFPVLNGGSVSHSDACYEGLGFD